MNVTIFTTNPPNIYSGGRYLSLILAHSLARAGASVTYVTNNAPLFERDFDQYQAAWPLRRIVAAGFQLPEDMSSDWVIVIPTGGFDSQFYNAALRHAQGVGARVALLCFETPNWYAALSPYARSPMPTESWRQVVASGGLVVTIANEAIDWARAYFGTDRTDLEYAYWHPPINDLSAEVARSGPISDHAPDHQRKRVTTFVRVEDRHKGAWDLLDLPPDIFDGYILSLVFGRGIAKDYLDTLRQHFASSRNFLIDAYAQITDEHKFRLLGESRLLLFPSYFEGFGYPPVEAAQMGAPTVAYDLPLLREVAGDAIRFVAKGDTAAFAGEVRKALAEDDRLRGDVVRQKLKIDPGTLQAGRSMLQILQNAEHVRPAALPPVAVPVRQNPIANSLGVRARMTPPAAGPRLAGITVSLDGRRLNITGSITNAQKGSRLQFLMPDARIADARVNPVGKQGRALFETSGIFEGWPGEGDGDGPVAAGLVVQLAQPGLEPLRLGYRTVELDWATLMLWPDGRTRVPAATEEHPAVNLVLRPDTLVDHLDACSILAAACETLDRMGRRVRLLLHSDGTPACRVRGIQLELLPRVHEAFTGDIDQLRSRVAAAYESREPVLLGPGMANLMPRGARSQKLSTRPGGDPASDVQLWTPGSRGGRVEVRPGPTRARRTLADQARSLTVILAPGVRLAEGLDPQTCSLLKHLEARFDRLKVVIPSRLWCDDADPRFGIEGYVRACTEAELSTLITEAANRVAFIPREGPEDPLLGGLLSAFSVPQIRAFDLEEPLSALAVAASCRPVVDECQLGRVIEKIIRPAPPPIIPRGPQLSPIPASSTGRAPPPILRGEQRMSFSNTLGSEPSSALLGGWKDRDMYGARMSGSVASLVYNFDAFPDDALEIELLVRLRTQSRAKVRLRVYLNDIELPHAGDLREGFSVHKLQISPDHWLSGNDPQVVLLELEADPEVLGQCEFTLAAFCLHQVASAQPWRPSPTANEAKAPLRLGADAQTGRLSIVRFGRGDAIGWLSPTKGWSDPEDGHRWSDGHTAVLTLDSRVNMNMGVALIRLVGPVFVTDALESQQVNVRILGTTQVTRFCVAAHTEIEIPITAGSIGNELHAHILLEFPDAASPHDLGISEDGRKLGLALQEASIERFEHCLSSCDLTVERSTGCRWSGAPLRLPETPAVLRLSGAGPLPGGEFTVSHQRSRQTPTALAGGGWEVCFPLRGIRDVAIHWSDGSDGACEVRLPQQLVVEVWTPDVEVPEGAGANANVVVTTESVPPGPSDHLNEAADSSLSPPTAEESTGQHAEALPDNQGPVLAGGWSVRELAGTWSDGPWAEIVMPSTAGPAAIVVSGHPFLPAPGAVQEVSVSVDQNLHGSVLLNENSPPRFVLGVWGHLPTTIALNFPHASSPKDFGLSIDERKLGLFVESLSIVSLEPVEPSTEAIVLEAHGPIDAWIAGISQGPLEDAVAVWIEGSGHAPEEAVCAQLKSRFVPEPAENGWRFGMAVPDAVLASGPLEVLLIRSEAGETRPTHCTLTRCSRAMEADVIMDHTDEVAS